MNETKAKNLIKNKGLLGVIASTLKAIMKNGEKLTYYSEDHKGIQEIVDGLNYLNENYDISFKKKIIENHGNASK